MAKPTARRRIDWPAAAEHLARLLPRARLHPAVRAAAEAMPPRTIWGVGFSGGPDSLALLLLLWAHWPARRRSLRALHFNHRLRGVESRADAVFCRGVCRSLGVAIRSGAWPGRHEGAGEAEARAARMGFFARHARVIWFGHQLDDVAESMLMRLARGSGTAGLAAPRPVVSGPGGRVHLRPLLGLRKTAIVSALHEAGVAGRQDSSNAEGDYFRNRIRHDVIPAWTAAARRDAVAGAAHSRMLLEEDDAALAAWLEELPWRAPGRGLAINSLAGRPRGLVRRALHRWLLEQAPAGDLSRQGFEALLASVERGAPTRHSLGREGFAVIRDRILRFEKAGRRRAKITRSAN
jgi:tRNA(Ile)-lysidine synthase